MREGKLGFWLDPAEGGWSRAETLALLLWCAVAALAVWQHVPWADESQAWMLAGGVGWKRLFLHSLHYEGTGGLWHAFLKGLQALGVSFTGARWIAAAIEGAAMAVLLGLAPFPRAVRLLLPFTFFLLFQDGVVARSYCLFAILAFPAAALLRSARPRPFALALLTGLLANLSVHGAVLSGALAIVAWFRWRREFRRSVSAVAVLLALWGAAVFTMSPAPDVDFQAGNNLHRSLAKVVRPLGIRMSVPAPVYKLTMAGLEPAPVPVHIRHGAARVWNRAARILGVLTFPLSRVRGLALLLLALMVTQAFAAERGLGLVPWALMAAVFSSLYLQPRHAGTVLTALVVTAWLTWPESSAELAGSRRWLERVTAALLLAMCVEQIGWTARAIFEGHKRPYSPAKMTAEYLKSRAVDVAGSGKRVAGFYYFSSAPLLYFSRNIYFNQPPHRYWSWSTADRNYQMVWDTLAAQPDFVVVGGFEPGPEGEVTRDWEPAAPPEPGVVLGDGFGFVRYFEQHGYRETHVFCGHSEMRAGYAELLCDRVLERR